MIIMMGDPPTNCTECALIVNIVCNLINSHILAWEVFPDAGLRASLLWGTGALGANPSLGLWALTAGILGLDPTVPDHFSD